LGGVVWVGAASYFNISESTFDISHGKIGGALYVENVANVSVQTSSFLSNCALNGPGGAIFFGENTGFCIQSFPFFFIFILPLLLLFFFFATLIYILIFFFLFLLFLLIM
jgi:hypothetical protein